MIEFLTYKKQNKKSFKMRTKQEEFQQIWERECGYIDRERAAWIIGVCNTQVSNYAKQGKIKTYEAGKKTLYSFKDTVFLRSQREVKKKKI